MGFGKPKELVEHIKAGRLKGKLEVVEKDDGTKKLRATVDINNFGTKQTLADLRSFRCDFITDLAKKTETVDREHPKNSSIYAQEIVSKGNFDENFQKRIVNMVKYHHWYQDYDYDNPHETACKFRYTGDFEVAAIMTAADIKAVGEGFGEMYLQKLPRVCEDVLWELDEFYETGNFALGDEINSDSVGFKKKL